jgi:NitT/TauT family transport system substrate-binding protein
MKQGTAISMGLFGMLMLLFGIFLSPNAAATTMSMAFVPHWLPQAQFAGYYVAQEKGFYRREGIDVRILRGGPESPPAEMLTQRKAAATSMFLSEALQLRDKGLKLINICQLMQKSGFILVARRSSGIVKPRDLNGRRISLWNHFRVQPQAFFRKYGIEPHILPLGTTVNLFLRGGVDGAAAMWYNEYHMILNAGLDAEELTTFFFDEHGLNFPEDGIYVLEETYRRHPEWCHRFVRATLAGWTYAFEHPEEALDVVMHHAAQARTGTNRVHQRWMLARMKDLMRVPDNRRRFGTLDAGDYEVVARELLQAGLIRGIPPWQTFYRDITHAAPR